MEKNRLLLLPFFIGLALMIYSWSLSYPLSVNSANDSVFNHVSVFYWVSFPLLLTSMYLIALTLKSRNGKWIIAIGFVMIFYSLSYFYYALASSDAQFFTGLTQYFIRTKSLNPSTLIHSYYQWPSFFVLADITTSVSGLGLASYEFLLFTVIGFLLATALYVYASTFYNRGGFLAVMVFFVTVFYFLNYQAVPFSLALSLLFLLFMLETQKKSFGSTLVIIVLFISISITHAVVPLFFVFYSLIRSIVSRSRLYFEIFLLTLSIYFLVQITLGQSYFTSNIITVMSLPSEYSGIVGITLGSVSTAIDIIAQTFSRTVTIAFVVLSFVGFVFLLVKRKLRDVDKVIFLTGVVYAGLGMVIYALGSRAIPIVFVPVSLGVLYLFKSKVKPYLECTILILLILVVFVPIHTSFINYPITFQTKEALTTANFMIEKYDWNSESVAIADSGQKWYISPQIQGFTEIETAYLSRFGLSNITTYDCIIYSVGLAMSLQRANVSIELTSQQILDRFNVVYNSGYSYVAEKTRRS